MHALFSVSTFARVNSMFRAESIPEPLPKVEYISIFSTKPIAIIPYDFHSLNLLRRMERNDDGLMD